MKDQAYAGQGQHAQEQLDDRQLTFIDHGVQQCGKESGEAKAYYSHRDIGVFNAAIEEHPEQRGQQTRSAEPDGFSGTIVFELSGEF